MRPSRALINLDALRHNYRIARQYHGGRVLAVIKANAYGHGAITCASALATEADGFAVALLEEALALREAGIRQPILLLEGPFSERELKTAAQNGLWVVIHHAAQLEMLLKARTPQPLNVWLKIDSGMHRAGFDIVETDKAWQALKRSGKVGTITLMTHLARADEPGCATTARQIELFDQATAHLPGPRSLSNSAGLLGWQTARRDWARAGILLYGADPMPDAGNGLRPVMTLESRVVSVRQVPTGEAVGYGGRFVTQRPSRIGLVAMGYADGYPRVLPDGTPVSVDGAPATLAGRVSMDMLTVDLTDVPQAGEGSRVEFWGEQVPINQVATAAGTIAYELLCNTKRVQFEYVSCTRTRHHDEKVY